MKRLSIILLSLLIQITIISPVFVPSANATVWCQKPIERAIKGTSAMTFGATTPVNATLFIATQSTDKICAVDLHINATPGSCSGNFNAKIYGNNANYSGSGTDGPDTSNLIGTSLNVDCSTFVTDTGTFFNYHDQFTGNTNRFSFTPNADGTGTSTIASPLVAGTKYWLVVTAMPGTVGGSSVGWALSTAERQDATTGRRRGGASVSTLTTTNATGAFGQFKFYADYPTGIYMDSTYNCDDLSTNTPPYTTTVFEPGCDDSDITEYGANTGRCSITINGFGNGNPAAPGYRVASLDGPYEIISSASNYPGGGGSKGQRHWLGIIKEPGSDANASGGLMLYFQYPGPTEMWMRAYIRYQSGWQWGGLAASKTYYPGFFMHRPECNSWYLGCFFGSAIDGPDGQCHQNCQHGNTTGPCNTGGPDCAGQSSCVSLACQNGTGLGIGVYAAEGDHKWSGCIGCFWKDMYPTGTSDGTFHALEVHQKVNSRCGGALGACDGIMDIWVDGNQIAHVTNVDYGYPMKGGDGITPLPCTTGCNPLHTSESPALMGVNQIKMGANGNLYNDYNTTGCYYIDYDDVKISTDGYIGPISNNIPLAAGRPTNVHVE